MSQKSSNPSVGESETPRPANSNYFYLGLGVVAFLILIVVVMIFITSGDVSETPAPASLSAEASAGKALFISNNCVGCHPAEGRAGGTGPRLSTTGLSDESIANTIRKGRGVMPAYKNLSDGDVNNLVTYIRAIKPSGK